MRDGQGRVIDYLRISITDRCNFRCLYCMPSEGVRLLDAREILSYEELLRVIRVLGQYGVSKIRLTGGEPLVRKGVVNFIRNIRAIGTVKDLSMTTNGSLLRDMAPELKAAGLDRVNISLDTLDPERFTYITDKGNLTDVLKGIESAVNAGLTPVKLNVVLTEVLTEKDVLYFIKLVYNCPIAVRFIEYMPVGRCGVKAGTGIAAIKSMLNGSGYGQLEPESAIKGNGPAKYYRLPRASGMFGFITPISDHFCQYCNRIRLTADGKLKPCLLSDQEIDMKAVLRGGGDDRKIAELFFKAVQEKPVRHRLGNNQHGTGLAREMFQVGG
ncbi:molybdenum cofactor synthesis c [Lucifera butyrica]|uniref:GTP 3',8-cyclase n=2 Tax=Lucifera butyrica TaxID=1351585 RepID=A0A498R8V6_9FIRM|nr:molybdenum cofactor synthesis c [Lucifera butyrica]